MSEYHIHPMQLDGIVFATVVTMRVRGSDVVPGARTTNTLRNNVIPGWTDQRPVKPGASTWTHVQNQITAQMTAIAVIIQCRAKSLLHTLLDVQRWVTVAEHTTERNDVLPRVCIQVLQRIHQQLHSRHEIPPPLLEMASCRRDPRSPCTTTRSSWLPALRWDQVRM